MKDIEKELEEYFKNEPIPQLSIEEKDKIKSKIKSNSNTCEKSQSKNGHRPRILPIFITCLIILIPCIVLPITLTRQKQIYFKDTTAEKLELTIDNVKNIIDEKLPQHTFLYNDYDINFAEGYFIPQSNNLLAMTLDIKSRDLPYTQINIC